MRAITPTIETQTGHYFPFDRPSPLDVRLDDIAGALSKLCRFNGHCERFYSVAEHALLVHGLVVEMGHPELALAALHHDSHEAYLGDIPTPLKRRLGAAVDALSLDIDCAVARTIGVDVGRFYNSVVKAADEMALRIEAFELKPSRGLDDHWGFDGPPPLAAPWELGMSPDEAAAAFLDVHHQEMNQCL